MPENLHYTCFWAGLEQCRWRAEEGENPSPCPAGFSWHREVWAGSGAEGCELSVVTPGGVWPVKMQLNILWYCWSQHFTLRLRAVSGQLILGAYQLPPCPSHRDWAGTFRYWACEKAANLVLQQTDLQRLVSDTVPGGMISSDPQRMTSNNVLCGLEIEPFVQYFWHAIRKFLPSFSLSISVLSACFVFNCLKNIARLSLLLFSQVDGQPAACSCISKLWDRLF